MAFQDDPGEGLTALDFDFDRDPPRLAHMAAIYNADEPDLGAFAAAGGRMITWHGLADAVVPHGKTVAYFQALTETHGQELASFDRLFLIPGMDHCGIQPGPGIDQSGFDPLTALENWLETGTAPETLLTTRSGADGQAEWSRPVCAWPQVARYDGTGDWHQPESFTCAAP
jgi:feruloyl esterase